MLAGTAILTDHHWSWFLIRAVMILWVVPAGIWRNSAIVMLAIWLYADFMPESQVAMPVYAFFWLDCIAIVLIWHWRSSWLDKAIIALFPIEWYAYANVPDTEASGYLQWWVLYWLTLAQFILAGPWPYFARNRTLETRRGGTISHYSDALYSQLSKSVIRLRNNRAGEDRAVNGRQHND